MRRFFIEEIQSRDGYCTITGHEAKHIARVLRMGKGDRFVLMDGRGTRYQVVVESTTGRGVRVFLEKPLPGPSPSSLHITLCQAVLKSRAMDWVIEKASELGVDSICPFFSERTVMRDGESDLTDRLRHWQKVAQSAAKQSDRLKPAEIDPPQSFKDLLKRLEGNEGLKAVLWEAEKAEDLKGLITKSSLAREFVGVVGPEGGFSAAEVQSATRGGFQSVSLGRRILRAETAAITLVAIVQYEWGDLRRQ